MKTFRIAYIAPLLVASLTLAPALRTTAQQHEADLLTIVQVIDRLTALGYVDVLEVELERDDRYEAEARGPDGNWYEIEIDAYTGELLSSEPDPH